MTDDAPDLADMLAEAIDATSDNIAAHVDRLDALVDLRELAERGGHASLEALLDATRDPIERGRRLALCRRATTNPEPTKEK